jgi:UDP-glucose 4-epimerase
MFDTDDGTCVRDYIHVWDLATAHIQAVDFLLDDYPQAGSYRLNLGTGGGITNRQIANYIKKQFGLKVQYGPARPGDPAILTASSIEAQTILGWTPEYSSIETIIDSAYKWYTR